MNAMFTDTDYQKTAKILANANNSDDFQRLDNSGFMGTSQTTELEACIDTWKIINNMQEINQFDTDNAWNKLKQRLSDEELIQPADQEKKMISMKRWLSMAAAIILLVGFTSLWFWTRQSDQATIITNNLTEPQKVELPDGSKVYLNKDAQLSYYPSYNQKDRAVKLIGEAFFEVVPNPQKPFYVECNQTSVKVLGTSFNVTVSAGFTEVIVATGKVAFYKTEATETNVILLPGEKGLFTDGALIKSENEKLNFRSWMDHKLVFKAMPLPQVINDINHTYHCQIEIGDSSINNLVITTTFDSISLDEIMKSISLAFDLKLVKQSETNYLLLK
jgi:transmembrane sensor